MVNHETKMYKSQPNFDGYNNTDFILPGGASYNDPGSGNGSDYVTSSHSSSRASSYNESERGTSYGRQQSADSLYRTYRTPSYSVNY